MTGILVILCGLAIQGVFGDVFASKSITRALVPPRRESDYRRGYPPTTPLPEVIVNRDFVSTTATPQRDSQGYFYDPPSNAYIPPEQPFADEPVPPTNLADEYPSIDNQYLPPNEDLPPLGPPIFSDPPTNEYIPPAQPQPPQRDEIVIVTTEAGYQYNPPSSPAPPFADEGVPNNNNGYNYDPPANGYLPPTGRALRDEVPTGPRTPIRLQLNELTCLPNVGGFFRSTITIQSPIDSSPLVDIEDDSDLTGCNVRVDQTRITVNIDVADFSKCGVQQCGPSARELCLRLRFPQIGGMRTVTDAILTLQCKIQQRVVARTHSVRVGISNDAQARSASDTGTFAYGGSQRPFRSQLGLFRRGQGNGNRFTRSLEPGGAVMLGEELLLRTQVRSGDGWNYTRLSDVAMLRLSASGTVLNSATLVTTNGCLNPSMKAVCPAAPVLETPLSYRLGLRAAMFQGMRSGDEMVLRVRVVGCVDRRECTVDNCATVRSKRDVSENSSLETTTSTTTTTAPPSPEHELPSEITSISFRIMLPSDGDLHPVDSAPSSSPSVLTLTAVAISLIVVTALLVLLAFGKLYRTRKQQPTYDEYRSD
ncbi:conserved hypothetical protein [Culex quinquefasciatus]|uniref:ZP domain-containing protein n=1 Tax=Culex quinquefasciatus TaxID=7176 RepID=B0W587_CULQU|nr:conserved hypothetical protein [Culex quinquefasciatus]|eukprot:XP_001843871.1 conserved hypothetical protein [Culex quinquefasciatus]